MTTRKVQRETPYSFIEEWWGEPLSAELLSTINSAPIRQLRAFNQDYPTGKGIWKLSEIPNGSFRPLLRSASVPQELLTSLIPLPVALNLLLYAHELILDDPLQYAAFDKNELMLLRRGFEDLLALKPFDDAGILYFGPITSMPRHPSQLGNYAELGVDLTDTSNEVFELVNGISMAKILNGRAHPLAYGYRQYELMANLFRRTRIDNRNLDLATLASLNVPLLRGRISELIAVRKSNDDFALWRDALSRALSHIAGISDSDEAWQADALAIVQAELAPLRERIQNATKKSAALTALQAGVSALSIGALGPVTAWAVGGSLIPGLAGAEAITGANTLKSYAQEMKIKHRNRAILDLVLAFESDITF